MTADRVYLTFDIDWAPDDVLGELVEWLEGQNVKATFFVTHDSPLIRELADRAWVERGIHPQWTDRLTGRATGGEPWQPLVDLMKLVPEAVSSRSHSLIQGTPMISAYAEQGLRIDANPYLPFSQLGEIAAWSYWTGTRIVPFVWSDYIDFVRNGEDALPSLLERSNCLKVVAFHPIHVYLNTSDVAHYERYRASGLSPAEARAQGSSDKGVGDALREFVSAIHEAGLETGLLRDLLAG